MNESDNSDAKPDRNIRLGDRQTDDRSDVRRKIHYLVNGERQVTEEESLTVEEILRRAGSGAGIDVDNLDKYYLERVADDRKYRSLTDEVRLKDGDKLLAVYSGRTPVA